MKEGETADHDESHHSDGSVGGVTRRGHALLCLASAPVTDGRRVTSELMHGGHGVDQVVVEVRESFTFSKQRVGKFEDVAMNEKPPRDSGIENGEHRPVDPEGSRFSSKGGRGRIKTRKVTGGGDLRGRTGRYDLVKDGESGGESDGLSVELEDGDSNFNSDDECSSISVSGSEDDGDHGPDSQHGGGDQLPPLDDHDGPSRGYLHTPGRGLDQVDPSAYEPQLAGHCDVSNVHLTSYKVNHPPDITDMETISDAHVGDAPVQLTSQCRDDESSPDKETTQDLASKVYSYPYNSQMQLSSSLKTLHWDSNKKSSLEQNQEVSSLTPSSRFVGGNSLNQSWVARINKSLSAQTIPEDISRDPSKRTSSGQIVPRPMKHFGESFNKFVQAKLTKTFSDNRHDRYQLEAPRDDGKRNSLPRAETQFARNESYKRACSNIETFTLVEEDPGEHVTAADDLPVLIPDLQPAETLGQNTSPLVGQTTGPMVGQTTGPMVGQATGPMVGQATEPMVGQATSPMVGQATSPLVGQATSPLVGQTTSHLVGQTTSHPVGQATGPLVGQGTSPLVESDAIVGATLERIKEQISEDLDLLITETCQDELRNLDTGQNESKSESCTNFEPMEVGSVSDGHTDMEHEPEAGKHKVHFSFPDHLSPPQTETREPLATLLETPVYDDVVFVDVTSNGTKVQFVDNRTLVDDRRLVDNRTLVDDRRLVDERTFVDDRRKSLPNFQEDNDTDEEEDDYIPSSHLSRKPAVRRKGYTFVSKSQSLPQYSRSKSHDPGSSLDLAPSLLNLYDNINATVTNNHGGHHHHATDDGADKSQRALTKVTKTQSLPVRSQATPRSTQAPQTADRLASMQESDESGVSQAPGQPPETKKRPLSNSSMSSTSNSSSLQRLRKKRANHGGGDKDPPDAASRVRGSEGGKDGGELADLDGEERKSSDVDDPRDDVDSSPYAAWEMDGVHTPPLDETPSKLPRTPLRHRPDLAPTPSSASSQNQSDSSRSWMPRSKRPDSILNGRVSTSTSDLNDSKNSRRAYPQSPPAAGSSPSGLSGTLQTSQSTPDSTRSTSSSSRHEARKRFFSNYEDSFGGSTATPSMSHQEKGSAPAVFSPSTDAPVKTHVRDDVPCRPPENGRKQSSGSGMGNSSEKSSTPEVNESLVKQTTARPVGSSRIDRENGPVGSSRSDRENGPVGSSRSDRENGPVAPSEKSHRRTERRSAFRAENQGMANSSLQKTAFTKSTKRKDTGPESGNKSGPVYVSYVQRVVTEIIESERIYIGSLEDIINGYLSPLEQLLSSEDATKDVECLFGNIRQIYQFGCIFLTDLESTAADPVKVAECFVKHNKGFVIYADYCTNYPRAVQVLTKFMQHPELSEFCKERQLALSHGLPLGAYLLRPVQRILKYHLLLQNIVKSYEKEGKDVTILEQAFHHMTQMAHHINEMKRKHEHAVRVQEIQSQLEDYVGEDLTRLGDLVLESTFRVYGAKASRQVFLFERGLLISKKKGGGMLSCKTFIKCSNLMLVEVIPNEPLSFHVIPFDNPRAQYTLQARNMEQKKKWCQEIKRLILESFKGRIPDSVKDLVMQLGSNHDDDYVTKEALEAVRKNQHTAPEYLEKRKFRRKSGSRLPDFSILKPQKAKRAANKKNDVKLDVKGRRAESKSPDADRRLLMPQNAIKRRSQSHNIVMSGALTPEPAKGNQDQDTTLEFEPSPLSPSATSSDSSFMQTPDNSKVLTDAELETEVQLRPRSFRNAVRAHPITSVELNELLSRMRGSGLSRTSEESTKQPDLPAARPLEQIESTLRNIDDSSEEDIADNVSVSTDTKKAALTSDLGQGHDSQPGDHKHNATDSLMPSEIQFNKAEREKLIMTDARSTSMPDLNLEEVGGVAELKATDEGKSGLYSQSVTNVNKDEYAQKGKGRLSRKDFHNSHIVKRRMKGSQDGEPGNTNVPRPVTAFHDSYSKRAAEKAALRTKGAQPANKEKHLSTPESSSHHQNSNAKLTVWNSVEKLTKGSMNDLSHLNEDPWVMNPEVASSTSCSDLDTHVSNSSHLPKPFASLGVTSRPRGHSDITEMMQVSLNKENFDWLVYLNRNSFPPKSDQTSPATRGLSSLGTDPPAASQDSFSSQFHYATPPRSYMNTGNMNRHGSGYKESSFSQTKPGVSALGGSTLPISLTKPIQFHAHGLMRSNSSPMAGADKTVHKDRPTSLDADNLTDESDQMLAEMEAYISNSSDSIKSTNKFPTSLPAITVEDEDANNNNINRLSIASSLSTSSYDSQDSNSHSSDGLVGTLRHKLHTWAKRSTRHDSEQSHTSTLTSDDEDTETPKPTSNTFDPPLRNRNSWREDRDLENVLREHGLGSTSLGSRMAFSMPTNVGNPSQPHHCSDIEIEDPVSPGGCGLSDTETPKFDSSSQNETNFSLPPAKEGEAVLQHPATSRQGDVPADTSSDSSECVHWDVPDSAPSVGGQCDSLPDVKPLKVSAQGHYGPAESNFISESVQRERQAPDSGISFQNTDTQSGHPILNDNITLAEPSKEIPPKVNPKVKSNGETNNSEEDRVILRKRGSFGSIDSVDSFYERRLSVAFDSDVFQDNHTIVGVYEDGQQEGNVEAATPRKSIREYVQQIEQKLRPPSPKIFEVKRREPGAMIRQRLETLRENVLYGRRSSSRQGSEEREGTRAKSQPPAQFRNKLTRATKFENRHSEDLRLLDRTMAASRDSLSKSMENLSKPRDALSFSRESLLLSKSRDSLNSDSPTYQYSLSPLMNQNCGTPGHESDANRFTYINVEHKGNQFLHRARSNSDQPESDTAMSVESGTLSRSMCRLDQVNAEVDNLVIMKGWVRALISKFQQKD